MKRHSIDKFGRILTQSYKFDDDAAHIDMGNKRLRFVADPVDLHESVNRGYLDKLYIPLEQRVKHLENLIANQQPTAASAAAAVNVSDDCIKLSADKKSWDARGMRIVNVAAAENMEDASRLSQTCTYDDKSKNFKVGNKVFDLVETSVKEPVIVSSRLSSFGPLEFTAYKKPFTPIIPTYSARWKTDDQKMVDSRNLEIVWDEKSKKFAYRVDMTTW